MEPYFQAENSHREIQSSVEGPQASQVEDLDLGSEALTAAKAYNHNKGQPWSSPSSKQWGTWRRKRTVITEEILPLP